MTFFSNPQNFWCSVKNQHGRLMGIDWGKKHLGLATSDKLYTLAHPLKIHKRKRFYDDIQVLRDSIKEQDVHALVIGQPSGHEKTPSIMPSIRSWAYHLHSCLNCPYTFYDEDFSSDEAQELARKSHQPKKILQDDDWSAAIMLQRFLDHIVNTVKH